LTYSPGDPPTEKGAPRRGGRGFYRDRDLPYQEPKRPGPRHESRDARRSPDAREAAELGRELATLADKFTRFRGPINRLRHHVLVQARSEDWKLQTISECLGADPLSIEEIIEETDLDQQSVNEGLFALGLKGEAVRCNRNGGAIVIRRDNKPAEKVYWRRARRAGAAEG
jgi:hypothetical protein